jgi:3-hydroxyisobutyrate dehydrogenase-like beta-hydroxyacid dehydrogenase
MGHALASRLLDGGHQLAVWNRTPGRAAELVERGAREATSIRDAVGESDVALSIVANDDAVRAVALERGGIIDSLGARAVYVDSSTVSPETSEALAAAAGEDRFAAMPVLGAPNVVRSGDAGYLIGAEPEVAARLQPLVASLSTNVRHFDSPGHALAAKLASNLVLLADIVALAEAIAVGRAGGLSDEQLRDLFDGNGVVAPAALGRLDGVLGADDTGWWSTTLGAKDAHLAVALAQRAGVALPDAEAIASRFDDAALRDPHADIASVGALYRE